MALNYLILASRACIGLLILWIYSHLYLKILGDLEAGRSNFFRYTPHSKLLRHATGLIFPFPWKRKFHLLAYKTCIHSKLLFRNSGMFHKKFIFLLYVHMVFLLFRPKSCSNSIWSSWKVLHHVLLHCVPHVVIRALSNLHSVGTIH